MVTIDTMSASSRTECVPVVERTRFSWRRAFAALRLRWAKRCSRLALLELNDYQLRDIGISYEDARQEAAKSHLLRRML